MPRHIRFVLHCLPVMIHELGGGEIVSVLQKYGTHTTVRICCGLLCLRGSLKVDVWQGKG
jgi:hypothetical protein